jgi:hypothetical protein
LKIPFYTGYDSKTYIEWENAIITDNNQLNVNITKLMDLWFPEIPFRELVRKKINEDGRIRTCDIRQLCNGHDVMYVVYVLLKRHGRTNEVELLRHKSIEKFLRLA